MASLEETLLIPARELAQQQARQAAALVIDSLPEYYNSACAEDVQLQDAVAQLFRQPGNETSTLIAALADDQVVGVYSGLAADRLQAAQMAGALALRKALPDDIAAKFWSHLGVFRGQIPPAPPETWYVARLAVAPAAKGRGVADKLMDMALQEGAHMAGYSAHVHRENQRSLGFFGKRGFRLVPSETRYQAVVRDADHGA